MAKATAAKKSAVITVQKAPAKIVPWKTISKKDRGMLAKGYVHFTAKTTSSLISGVGIRLGAEDREPKLPYLGLSVLGASLAELDYTEGGAAAQPKPRQVKDYVCGKINNGGYNLATITQQEILDLAPNSAFVDELKERLETNLNRVDTGLRQVIVADEINGGDVVLTPIGAIGLNGIILSRLNNELKKRRLAEEARAAAANTDPKAIGVFWRAVNSSLGGSKPQNVGIQCTGEGGMARAQFAWRQPAPGFPKQTAQQNYSTLYRGVQFRLAGKDIEELKNLLEIYAQKPNFRSGASLEKHLAKIMADCKGQAKKTRDKMGEALADELKKKDILLDAINGDWAAALLSADTWPKGLSEAWGMGALNAVQKGWLVANRNTDWPKKAAAEWVRELKRREGLHLDEVVRQKLEALVAEELSK